MTRHHDTMTADEVLTVLREKLWTERAHGWLYNVGNATGWASGRQFADALVVSLWPSRGIWCAGVEVKVYRSDWKRELEKPRKSAEIQSYCERWWVAAPVGVVELGELPDTWGLVEIDGGKPRVAKEAPKLEAKPPTWGFVAACLRREANSQASQLRAAEERGWAKAAKEYDADAVQATRAELSELKRKVQWAERDRDHAVETDKKLREAVQRYYDATGIDLFCQRHQDVLSGAVALTRAVQRLMSMPHLADDMERAAQALRAVGEATKDPPEQGAHD